MSLTVTEAMFHDLGLDSPVSRFLATFTVVEGVICLMKPSYFYTSSGNAKPWSLLSSDPDTVVFPFWLPGFIAGGVAALFV